MRPYWSYMLRFNKVSEYGVMALGYIGEKDRALSAREISDGLQIPYEITAKTLQRLKEAGFVESSKGTNGGYKLISPLSQINFAQVVEAIEGPMGVVECVTSEEHNHSCARSGGCGLKQGMQKVNAKVKNLLESITLDELMKPNSVVVESKLK
jgi:Rrf2 family protein